MATPSHPIEPTHFRRYSKPVRYYGPHLGQRLSFLHSHFQPLPEIPALTHLQEVWCQPEHLVPPHMHATHEITYVVSGKGRWEVEGQVLEVQRGDLWVAQPGEIHWGGADPADPYRIFVLGIDPASLLYGDASSRASLQARRELVAQRRSQGTLVLDEPARPWSWATQDALPYDFHTLEQRRLSGSPEMGILFGRLLAEMDHATLQPQDSTERRLGVLMIRTLLIELFVHIARCQSSFSTPQDSRFGTLCQWIQSRLHNPPSVKEMATLAGLSPAYFAESFKAELGQTPHEYVLQQRLEVAARRLRAQPEESVTRIALDLGFSSGQYFSVAFKQKLGVTPREWRNKKGRDSSN